MPAPVRVLHLALPRALSFSIGPWRQDLYAAVQAEGVGYAQVDLNPGFWRLLLDDASSDTVGRVLDLQHQSPAFNADLVARCAARLQRLQVPGVHIDFSGCHPQGEAADHSAALLAWVQADDTRAAWQPWLQGLDAQLAAADVLCFSVGSLGELALAAVLADHVRQHHPQVHACLGHHRWENFSLAWRLERLVREGALLSLFDSVLLREDRAGAALASLCRALRDGDLAGLQGIAVRLDGAVQLLAPAGPPEANPPPPLDDGPEEAAIADYLASTGLPADRLLLHEALVRNDCHYGRCTFCVQNLGYPQRQQYKHPPELQRTLGLLRHLVRRHGLRHVSFSDQAVHTGLLEALCSALEADPLPGLRWCIRMLPEVALGTGPMLYRLAALGCADILLGVESTDPATLRAMGKAHTFHGPAAHAWLRQCAAAGIDVTLSTIRAFPSESDAAFEAGTATLLRECAVQHRHVTAITNRFELFEGSEIAAAPARFGVAAVTRPDGDLTQLLNYVDIHGRRSGAAPPAAAPAEAAAAHLHYGSIGLLHRWRTGRWLADDLAEGSAGDLNGGLGEPTAPDPAGTALAPFGTARDTLVLGSTGYLGAHLARRLPAGKLVMAARQPATLAGLQAPCVAQDLTLGHARLAPLAPATVWLCARPLADDLAPHTAFLQHTQVLLEGWARAGTLRRLVVFSTQLVARTPTHGERVQGQSPLAPEAAYDCAKAQLEVFAGYLARRFGLSVDVVRLPLLWGGQPTAADRSRQFLHQWQSDLRAGHFWRFGPGDEAFGNSWVDVDDLVTALLPDPGPGLRVRCASSGDFTYAQLQQAWGAKPLPGGEMPLVRSRFLLQDELGLPPRGLPA